MPPPASTQVAPPSIKPGGISKDSSASSPELTHKDTRRAVNHQRRNEKRQRERLQSFSHYEPRFSIGKDSNPAIHVDLATESCSTAASAFVGLNDGTRGKKLSKLHELVGEHSKHKFEYVGWNGRYVI